uniref:NAD(P)(+)--arginine ADP-ribosyltransferase 2-like n=1 Tax=Centroberyx gerrardi TaxID=166262 RepID=UPI003AAD8D0D
MVKENMLVFTVLCCLCVWTRTLDAKTLLMQAVMKAPSKGPDVPTLDAEKSPIQDATKAPSLSSEDPVMAQNVSKQATMQNTTKVSFPAPDVPMQVASGPSRLSSIPLSLSPNSVDDMYYGCSQKMLIKVKRYYLPQSSRGDLQTAYTKLCARKAMATKDAYDPLSWDHFRALCAYTAGAYADFNRAVRKGKAAYKTSFEFHSLHFLLSDAVRLLKLNQRGCYTTYRRSRLAFSGEVGQTMRFGSFASSSLNKDLPHFGRKTCFEMHTCFGAYLKSYSEFDSDEDEVLIPPYEMFTIVSVDRSGRNDLQCDVLYKLETAGVYSSLNCQAVGA